LTTIPAAILGKSNEIGSLKTGSLANFIIASGEIFNDKTILYENWVQGNKFVINDIAIRDIRGDYDLTINSEKIQVEN
jgi:imidazolonepropionase-like amidohydrolase